MCGPLWSFASPMRSQRGRCRRGGRRRQSMSSPLLCSVCSEPVWLTGYPVFIADRMLHDDRCLVSWLVTGDRLTSDWCLVIKCLVPGGWPVPGWLVIKCPVPGSWLNGWLVSGWPVTGHRWLVDLYFGCTQHPYSRHPDRSYPGSIALWGGAPIKRIVIRRIWIKSHSFLLVLFLLSHIWSSCRVCSSFVCKDPGLLWPTTTGGTSQQPGTRGPGATTRSPEWNRHRRYADGMQHFSNTVKYWNLWQGNGLNSFRDILLTRLKCCDLNLGMT